MLRMGSGWLDAMRKQELANVSGRESKASLQESVVEARLTG